jgi:hypothetical protein
MKYTIQEYKKDLKICIKKVKREKREFVTYIRNNFPQMVRQMNKNSPTVGKNDLIDEGCYEEFYRSAINDGKLFND